MGHILRLIPPDSPEFTEFEEFLNSNVTIAAAESDKFGTLVQSLKSNYSFSLKFYWRDWPKPCDEDSALIPLLNSWQKPDEMTLEKLNVISSQETSTQETGTIRTIVKLV